MNKRNPIKTIKDDTIAVMRIAMKKRKRKDMTATMLDFFQDNIEDPTIKTILNDNKRIDQMNVICGAIDTNTLTKTQITNITFEDDELNLVHRKLTQIASPTTFQLVYESNESFKTYFHERHRIPTIRATSIFDSINFGNFELAKHLLANYEQYKITVGVYTQEMQVIKDVLSRVIHCRDFVWENIPMTRDEKQICFDRMTDMLDTDGIKDFLKAFPDF